ncbi:MAG: ATPase, partial [Pirellulaceae bacterium]|nr:ATPase [Pirellulaceae bacterium]
LLRTLVVQALGEMGDGGDLVITGCETPLGVELEVADSGCDIESRPQNLPLAAAAIQAKLNWQNCPQGGAAVTITFARRGESGRMAA